MKKVSKTNNLRKLIRNMIKLRKNLLKLYKAAKIMIILKWRKKRELNYMRDLMSWISRKGKVIRKLLIKLFRRKLNRVKINTQYQQLSLSPVHITNNSYNDSMKDHFTLISQNCHVFQDIKNIFIIKSDNKELSPIFLQQLSLKIFFGQI